MRRIMWVCVVWLTVAWATACTTTHSLTTSQSQPEQNRLQMALLPPSDWQLRGEQEQVLYIQTQGQTHQVEALLDVSDLKIHLVILKFGQRLITLQHDQQQTKVERGAYVPEFLQAQQVLQDMQVVYAKTASLQKVLPQHCSLVEESNQREIICNQQQIYKVDYGVNDLKQTFKSTRLINTQNQYSIQINTSN